MKFFTELNDLQSQELKGGGTSDSYVYDGSGINYGQYKKSGGTELGNPSKIDKSLFTTGNPSNAYLLGTGE